MAEGAPRGVEIPFTKMHGLGNDFVVVDARTVSLPLDLGALARETCHRRHGVGADGLILLLDSATADVRMRVFNADGSEPEMCGNGIRCLAGLAFARDPRRASHLAVETAAGVRTVRLVSRDDRCGEGWVEVDMGAPRLARTEVPMDGPGPDGPVVDAPLELDGATYRVTAVSMGNPHAVLFLDAQEGSPVEGLDLGRIPLEDLGPRLERHPRFPRCANVEFASVVGPGDIAVRVWERGAGATQACGTGACAVLVAATLTGRVEGEARVVLPGGPLQISWPHRGAVRMSGPYQVVFEGRWPHRGPEA